MTAAPVDGIAVRPLTRALRQTAPTGVRAWWRGHSASDARVRCTACGWEPMTLDVGEPSLAHPCVQADPVAMAPVPEARRRWVRRTSCLAVAVLVAATGVLATRGGAAVTAASAPTATRAIVLSGSSLSYPQAHAAAERLAWDARVFTVPGGGISRSRLDPLQSVTGAARKLLPAAGPAPDVVVLQGGEADHVASPATLQRATEHLIDYVRAHSGPDAQVVLVGPIPAGPAPDSIRAVNDVLAGVAAQRGVPFVDAVALGWTSGTPGLPDALAVELRTALSGS